MSGVFPHGAGCRELDPGDLVGAAFALDAGLQLLGPLQHRLRGLGLGRLGPHPVGLVGQRLRLVLGVDPLPLAALLVGLALLQVGLPAHVVDVDLRPVGVEVQDPVDGGLEQGVVVADHHEAALVGPEELAQPHDGVRVEVVGGLVEEERVGAREEDPGQLDPPPLSSRQGPQRLVQQPVLDAEAVGDLGGLRLRGVAAAGVQLRVGLRVAAHRPLLDRRVGAAHLALGGAQAAYDVVEAAGGQDPFPGRDVGVADAGILREVAHLPGGQDGAGRGQPFSGEDPRQGGLAGAVAPDQPDLVAGSDPEADVVHEETSPRADLEALRGDHQDR